MKYVYFLCLLFFTSALGMSAHANQALGFFVKTEHGVTNVFMKDRSGTETQVTHFAKFETIESFAPNPAHTFCSSTTQPPISG